MAEGSHRPALRITALSLQRFMGLQRRDQALHFAAGELSVGVTLIAGPNGSGKTTTARALEGILWPDSVTDSMADVRGNIEVAGEAWTVELAGPAVRWWRGGVPASGPSYCPATDRDRYRLSLHELLTADDAALAAGIRRELGGGYSLAEAAAQLDFSDHPTVPRKALQRLRQAEEAVAQATREQSGLRRSETDLSRLRAQEAEACQAAAQRETVAQLLRWRAAGRTLLEARRQVALYDRRTAALRGKEQEQFRDLQRRAAQAQAAGDRAAAELARTATALAAQRAGRPLPSAECLSRCRGLTLRLQQAENDVQRAQVERDGSQAKEAATRQVLATRLSQEQLVLLDRLQPDAALADTVRAASAASVAGGLLECFAALPLWAAPVADPAALEAQRRGLDLLRAWLQEPAPVAPTERTSGATWRPAWLAVAGTVLCLVLAVVAHWSLMLPALFLGLIAWLVRPRPALASAPSRRPEIEAGFARLGLALPNAWDADGVGQCFDELALRWSLEAGRRELAGQGLAARKVLEKQAAEQQRAVEECLARNTARLGVALDASPLAAFHLVTRIAAWQAARDEMAQASQAWLAARQGADTLLRRLGDELAASAGERPVDSVTAAAAVEALEKELAAVAVAEKRRDEQAQQVQQERQSAAEFADRARGVLESVGIRPDEFEVADELLARWTGQRSAAVAAGQAQQAALAQVTQCRAEARRAGAAARELQSLRTPQLERCRADLERAAAGRDQLLREIERTETLVREVKRKHDLEQRLAERDAALTELRREREQGWRALAGQGCVEIVAAGLEMQSSGVLRQAQRLFAQITRGRYRLLAEESSAGAGFSARDSETDRLHDLDSLSSGTRVQLLLAARLAFIAEKEGDGPLLPLLLDELLGNSDDARAGMIIDVVIEAARAGRQVFCFTAQQDEVSKWQARLAQAQVPFAVCWLPRAASVPPVVSLAPSSAPAVPRPQPGELPLDYAKRLGVPALDRFDTDAGSLHLWYLVEDLDTLHGLLLAGYRTWGQLATLLRAGGADAVLAGGPSGSVRLDPRRLEAKAELVVLVLALLRIGHGRPLGRAGLLASGLVTERYVDEVAQVLEHVGGDAALLAERLAQGDVKGFRSRSVDALSAWLGEQGYVDSRPVLSLDEIRARVYSTAAGYLADGVLSLDDIRGLLRLVEGNEGTRSRDAED
jgi:energy-coupling factor transporter ATP-binding protein EcfA2